MEAGDAANQAQEEGAQLEANVPWVGSLFLRSSGQVRCLPASLPTGMSCLLRAHLTQKVSDMRWKPHTSTLASPCSTSL